MLEGYIVSGCCMRASRSFCSNRAIRGAAKYLTKRLGKAAPNRLGVTKVVTPGLPHLRPVETNPQQFERATPAVEELTLYYWYPIPLKKIAEVFETGRPGKVLYGINFVGVRANSVFAHHVSEHLDGLAR